MTTVSAYVKQHLTEIIILGFSLLGMAMLFVATKLEVISLSPDSVHYFAAAKSFSAGHGFIDVDGTAFTTWPPLYPIILGSLKFVGLNLFWAARVLHIALFGTFIWLAALLAKQYLVSRIMLVLFLVLLTSSGVLLTLSVFAWTEPLFLVFVLVAFRLLKQHLQHRRWRSLVFLAVVAALACLTRYIGVALVGTVAVVILLQPDWAWRQRLLVAAAFLGITLAPLALWVVRYWHVGGLLFGVYEVNPNSFSDQFMSLGNVLTSWIVTMVLPIWPRLVLVGFIVAAVFGVRWRVRGRKTLVPPRLYTASLVIFAVTYFATMAPLTLTRTNQTIDERYLSILYPFLLTLFVVALERIYFSVRHRFVLVTVFLLVVFFNAVTLSARGIGVVAYGQTHGFGLYPKRPWQVPAFVQALAAAPAGKVYSNYPLQFYLTTGRAAQYSPVRNLPLPPELWQPSAIPRYLLWFEMAEVSPKPVYGFNWLARNLPLKQVEQHPAADGLVGWMLYSF